MASGGGNRPTNLSFSLPTSAPLSSSLQTPDTSSFFLSSLGGNNTGNNAGKDVSGSMLGNASPGGSQSFSSLEELLNVTGINSPDLVGGGSSGSGGVDSLQQLAKEVENRQQAELQPPAAKRPHIELQSPPPPVQPHPPTTLHQQQYQLPSNIRVQPLNLSTASQLSHPSVTTAYLLDKKGPTLSNRPSLLPPRTLPSPQVTSTASIAPSLFSGAPQQSMPSQHQLPTTNKQSGASSSLNTNLTIPPNFSSSPSFSFTTTSSSSLSNISFPTPPMSTTTSLQQPPQYGPPSQLQPVTTSVSSLAGNMPFFSRLPTSHPSGLSLASSVTSGHGLASQAPSTSLMSQPLSLGLGSIPATTSSSLGNSFATSPQSGVAANSLIGGTANPLIQLIQLYKQFHSQGDSQGMAKVKQQLNVLIARQKIIAAQNSLHAPTSGLSAPQTSLAGNLLTNSLNAGGARPAQSVSATGVSHSLPASTSLSMASQASQPLPSGQTAQQPVGGSIALPNLTSPAPLSTRPTGQKLQQQSQATVAHVPKSVLTVSQAMSGVTALGSLSHSTNVSVTTLRPVATSSPPQFPPPPTPASTGQTKPSLPKPPSSTAPPTAPPTLPQQQTSRAPDPAASQNLQQQIVKRLQTVIASLPEPQRPKTIPELRDFVQKYSSLITQNTVLDLSVPGSVGSQLSGSKVSLTTSPGLVPPKAGPSPSVTTRTSQSGVSIPSLLTSGVPSGAPNLSLPPATSTTLLAAVNISSATTQSPSAQVAEHFKSSLAGLATAKVPTVGGVVAAIPSVMPSSTIPPAAVPNLASGATAPSTVQFSHKAGTENSLLASGQLRSSTPPAASSQAPPLAPPTTLTTAASTSSGSTSGIQPGVAMPLPPGLTLETLGVLCRLPESDLLKLKLPPTLLSAIKVWKARQPPGRSVTKTLSTSNRNSIPVLTATGLPTSSVGTGMTATAQNHTQQSATAAVGTSPFGLKVGGTSASSRNFFQSNKASTSAQGVPQQPMVIPSSAGFPPRSLHAYIPSGLPQNSLPQKANSSTSTSHRHQTRYKAKVEHQKAETERLQTLAKALQSSEEARIAFRFSAHLDKMHTQLLNPDTITPFRSHHDILARLLPYHVYAEPEPPPAAVEKADAVFESVAQVLLSRSRGLTSRFQQIVSRTEAEGGSEQLAMKMQLERLFIEGEQERIRQEDIEKQQAEQVAADLSLMADGVDTFEPDFSLGDAFCPLLDMSDTGIT